ncbi:MAG TPA: AraC family transcriptional regulator [Steroidobacteraceae bacterium]|nr:AraC family transcriptional regulator [Steroidobacteraceae bacterium]
MFISFNADRPSSSPFIERVWSCHSTSGGPFLAIASTHWELVVTRLAGLTTVTLHGPETKPREVYCPPDGEWFAIRFKAGTFMPHLPVHRLINGQDVNLPPAFRGRFRLDHSAWEIPDFDNAEVFVNRLVHRGLLTRDAAVAAALDGHTNALHTRTAQRHFLYATGMSHTALKQIERARLATQLLREGRPPADVAHEAGYFDQAHLTRSLRKLIGLTPGSIAREERQLSFLYKA